MCGIAGQFNTDGAPVDREILRMALEDLRHRGPDEEGFHCEGPVGLAMRRLAIIDLSGGQQPKWNEDHTIEVIFNGEIYNHEELRKELQDHGHRFSSQSDTEVIVHAFEQWGEAFVERLNGMFAIALWDSPRKQMHLIRDPLGIKPLYYLWNRGHLKFASELDALVTLEGGGVLSPEGIANYLLFGAIPSSITIYEGMKKLAPGHRLVCDHRGTRIHRYWEPETHMTGAGPSREGEALEEFRRLLGDSVQLQRRSDVPAGLLLSGGLDSTAVAWAASERAGGMHAYTISMEGLANDEADVATATARTLGLQHHILRLDQPDLMYEALPVMARFDEPFHNFSAVPTWAISKLARQEVKVALAGDGGDEMLMGYPRYRLGSLGHAAPVMFRNLFASLGRTLPPLRAGAFWFDRRGLDPLAYLIESAYARIPLTVRRALQPQCDFNLYKGARRVFADPEHPTPQDLNRFDFQFYLPDEGLTKVDRMSMAHGLEMRVPLLDVRLVEFCLSLPMALRFKGRTHKVLLRRHLAAKFGEAFLKRPKQGFGFDVLKWVQGPLSDPIKEFLLDPDFAEAFDLQRPVLEKLASRFQSQRRLAMSAWTLACLAAWRRRRRGRARLG